MVKRKGAFYALESIGAALLMFYYLYKIFIIPIPTTDVMEKQNLYSDDLFYLASSLDDLDSYKRLWESQYDEKDLAYLYQYFVSKEGYFELYASNIPKKNILIGKYVEPYRTYFTHYLTSSYALNQDCITTFFNDDASFGVIDETREVKCKEGLLKEYKVLLVIDKKDKVYYKSLYIDANNNGKYDDDEDYVYTIGRFMDDDLFEDGSLHYIQDLPEENKTPYIYVLYPYEKEFFSYLLDIKSIGNYSLRFLLRFFTNTTPSFNGFDVIIWENYLPIEQYDSHLWNESVDFWYDGGDLIILAPIGNYTLLKDLEIYSNNDLQYSIVGSSSSATFIDEADAYAYKNGYTLLTLKKSYKDIPLFFNHTFTDFSSVTYNFTIYAGIDVDLSSSPYKAYVVSDENGLLKVMIDTDGDNDLNDEKWLDKGDVIMINQTAYKLTGYSDKGISFEYEEGPALYIRVQPPYFLSSKQDIVKHTLATYSSTYYALDPLKPWGDSYYFNVTYVGANTYK
ncbi:MAG: hypothetical protein GXN99_02880, partial [Candidatus Nanohaloarchaeota archaeon]|nr:hypothetical protein [Candidatus Nanohaloarchaeota archaeon]